MISDSWTGREKIDLVQELDLHVLDQEAQLGDRDPLPVLSLAVSSASPTLTLVVTSAPMSLPNPWKLPWPLISMDLFLGKKALLTCVPKDSSPGHWLASQPLTSEPEF